MKYNMILTADAQLDRQKFRDKYDDGNCSCFISPPCNSCIHPGNPANQDEDESCWEPAPWASRNAREGRFVGRWHGKAYRNQAWNFSVSKPLPQVCSIRARDIYWSNNLGEIE